MHPSEWKLFRSLEYLNLALNNITTIEGVGEMEWLRKLDLTLNFVDVDALEESVDELSGCRSLEELFLLGNPCMGLDGDGSGSGSGGIIPGAASASDDAEPSSSPKQIGWKGCRAYIVARLPSLQSLDGKEIKRSERILAMQQLSALTSELHLLAEIRNKERLFESQKHDDKGDQEGIDETYISDEAPTHHNPETRTKLSNELYDQKHAKEKQETAQQPPKPKGEIEWGEEHKDTVQKARDREERGREWERSSNYQTETKQLQEDRVNKKDGGIKMCNQGKHEFWFEEECQKDVHGKETATLIMRVAIPKYLSTSLVDVDIHPTYVSIVIKSKILRVVLPVEVRSDQSVARRSAASGYLELVMPKVDPNKVVIGLAHVRSDHGKDGRRAMKEHGSDCNRGGDKEAEIKDGDNVQRKRERLGQSIMKEAGKVSSLKIVQSQDSEDNRLVLSCFDDDDEDEPPPLC